MTPTYPTSFDGIRAWARAAGVSVSEARVRFAQYMDKGEEERHLHVTVSRCLQSQLTAGEIKKGDRRGDLSLPSF